MGDVAVTLGRWYAHNHITGGHVRVDGEWTWRDISRQDPPDLIMLWLGSRPAYGRRRAGSIRDWCVFRHRGDLVYEYVHLLDARAPKNYAYMVRLKYDA